LTLQDSVIHRKGLLNAFIIFKHEFQPLSLHFLYLKKNLTLNVSNVLLPHHISIVSFMVLRGGKKT